MVLVAPVLSRTARLGETMREAFDSRDFSFPVSSSGWESSAICADIQRGSGPVAGRRRKTGRPPLASRRGKRGAAFRRSPEENFSLKPLCKGRGKKAVSGGKVPLKFGKRVGRKALLKDAKRRGRRANPIVAVTFEKRAGGRGADARIQPPSTYIESPSVRACPNAPNNTNSFLEERKAKASCSPADVRVLAEAGGLDGFDDQIASLTTNLDFGGSNFGSNIGDMVLQQPTGEAVPSPQLAFLESDNPWAPASFEGATDGGFTQMCLVARINELERQVRTLNRQLLVENRQAARIEELEHQVSLLRRQLDERNEG